MKVTSGVSMQERKAWMIARSSKEDAKALLLNFHCEKENDEGRRRKLLKKYHHMRNIARGRIKSTRRES